MKSALALVLVASVLLPSAVYAQAAGDRLDRAFKRLDTNRNGSLSHEEATRFAPVAERLAGADADADGVISFDEFKSAIIRGHMGNRDQRQAGDEGRVQRDDEGRLEPGKNATRSIEVGDRQRRYVVHLPTGYRADVPTAVVIAFHGGGGNPQSMMRLSGLNEKADEAGFVVVYPYGTGRNPDTKLTFNGGDCCGYAQRRNIDDVAFVRALLDDLDSVVAIDANRVYATGLSNGGIMTYRVAAELSDRIAAIAPVAGPMGTERCRPTQPVSVIHFHGTADELAPFKGGKGKGSPNVPAFLRPEFFSVDHSIQAWVKANGCSPVPRVQKLPDVADDGMQVVRKTWGNGRDGSEVVLIKIEGGGHTWPGQKPPVAFLGKSTKDISANDLMWEFFQKHAKHARKAGTHKPLDNGDASEDASGTGQLFESIHVPGLTDFREGTNGIAFADFDRNGFLDALTVTTPPFVLSKEMKGKEHPRDHLRLLLNQGDFVFRSHELTLWDSPATPEDFGQGWRGSQIPVVADFDGDGRLDLFVSRQFPGVADRVRKGHTPVGCSLFLADGAFHTFTDVSRKLNVLNERAYNRQPSLGDVNCDGFIDIALGADNTTCAFEGIPKAALMVYEPSNNGDFASGTYRDVGGTDLVPDFGGFHNDPARDKAGPKVTLRDIDNDGDLDLFQSTHVLINIGYDAKRLPYSPAEYRQGVFTWRNMLAETGEFRFEKSVGNGLADEARLTYDVQKLRYVPAGDNVAPGLAYLFFGDVNNDGLYEAIAVDGTDALFTPKTEDVSARLWRNEGQFRFKEATQEATSTTLNRSYGEWYRFFNQQITPRLKNPLPLGRMNKSQPRLPATPPVDFRPYWGDLVFADFNNDTHLDFVVLDRREAKLLEPRSILYMNRGDGTFAPKPTTFSGLDDTGIAGEAVDLNNDGLVDLFISGDPDNTAPKGNSGQRYEDKVYLNTGTHGARENHWLRLRFGGISHAALLGVRVEAFRPGTKERLGTRGIYADHAYKTGSPLEAHFGLANAAQVDVTVHLLDGRTIRLERVTADRFVEINIERETVREVGQPNSGRRERELKGMELLRTPDSRFANLPDYDFEPKYLFVDDPTLPPGNKRIRMHYAVSGPANRPTLLMLHGNPSWSYLFRRVVPLINEAGYRTIMIDYVGHGKSDKPAKESDYTYDRHLEWIRQAFKQLDKVPGLALNEVVIFGHDYGHPLGVRLMAEHFPKRFDGFINCNAGLNRGTRGIATRHQRWRNFVRSVERVPVGAVICRNKGRAKLGLPECPDEVVAGYDAPYPSGDYQASIRAFPEMVPESEDRPEAQANQRAWGFLTRFQRPYMVIWENWDMPDARHRRDEYIAAIPGAFGHEQPQLTTSHYAPEDEPETVAAALVRFLDDIYRTPAFRPLYLSSFSRRADGFVAAGDGAAYHAANRALAVPAAPDADAAVTLQRPLDISGATEVKIAFRFVSEGLAAADQLVVELGDGIEWVEVLALKRGADRGQDDFTNGSTDYGYVRLRRTDIPFTEVVQLRFRCRGVGGHVYIKELGVYALGR